MAIKSIFIRDLDEVGDGSGNSNAVGDYSSVETEFKYTPNPGIHTIIKGVDVVISDSGSFDSGRYGNGLNLTNGIRFVLKKGGVIISDFTQVGGPVINNADYLHYTAQIEHHNFGAGDEYLQAKINFSESYYISMTPDMELAIVLNDDFTGLVRHQFIVKGYTFRRR